MKNTITPNPDLRQPHDPQLGEMAPVQTQIYYELEVKGSRLGKEVGLGTFAKEAIRAGAVVVIGGGQVVSSLANAPKDRDYAGVFDEKHLITPIDYNSPTPNWLINHSCDANIKVVGRLVLVARRDIKKGEELTVDYATVGAGDREFSMQCRCGSQNCRKIVTNNDWKIKELFLEHLEEWPPFIQKKA